MNLALLFSSRRHTDVRGFVFLEYWHIRQLPAPRASEPGKRQSDTDVVGWSVIANV